MSPKNLKQGYQYHKLGKTFSKLYHWYIYYDLISKIVSEYDQELPQSQSADNPMAPTRKSSSTKFHVGLESLLHKGLSEPEFYGNLAYTLKKIYGTTFSA